MKGDTRSLDYSSHVVWGLGSRDPLRMVWGSGFKREFLKISIADFSKRSPTIPLKSLLISRVPTGIALWTLDARPRPDSVLQCV